MQTLTGSAIASPYPQGAADENRDRACMEIEPLQFQQNYDREPFVFPHNLHMLELFQPDSLMRLCETFTESNHGYFVAAGAPTGGTEFYSVPRGGLKPDEALKLLDTRPLRILLKRPENQDPRFRVLMDDLFQQVVDLRGISAKEKVVRLEAAVLITSASTITPIHFDPTVGFFAQIAGEKIYHVYSPADTRETEMERFYIRGVFEIGGAKLEHRSPEHEHVYRLQPGSGFHQPQNACHWVETGVGRSVSYTFVYQTEGTKFVDRTRAFNHYERKLGIHPARPGVHPRRDAIKSEVMRTVIPLRQKASRALDRLRKEPASKPL